MQSNHPAVIAGHGRSKHGAASLAYVPAIPNRKHIAFGIGRRGTSPRLTGERRNPWPMQQ